MAMGIRVLVGVQDGRAQRPWSMMRMKQISLCLALLLLQGGAWTQAPGTQYESYLPATGAPPSNAAVSRAFTNVVRRLRKGSSADRLKVRQELMEDVERLLGPMLKELRPGAGNHFVQRQISLVLMQVGDARAAAALARLVSHGKRGARGVAGFALGALEDPAAVEALRVLSRDSHPVSKLMAYLALGRLGGDEAVTLLLRRLKERRPVREQEAITLGLGLSRSARAVPHLKRLLRQNKDGLRRAAAIAVGYMPAEHAGPMLLRHTTKNREEDKRVRLIALAGLSRLPWDEALYATLRERRPQQLSDADEAAAWVLALAALGREQVIPDLRRWLKSPREEVRAACAAATVVVGGPRASALATAMLGDDKDRVFRAALLATIVHGHKEDSAPVFTVWAGHKDERVRRAALWATVYRYGPAAEEALRACTDSDFKDDVRVLAASLMAELEEDGHAARRRCRARLQCMLDDEGLAPSWNLNAAANGHLYRLLDLQNAINRRGAGPAGGPDRGAGAVATAPSPEEEDLRRHLDRFPYADWRHTVEMPDPWTSSF